MSIRYVTGDLFTTPGLDAIAHGCNCDGVMGAGVAREIAKRWRDLAATYAANCRRGAFRLGDAWRWDLVPPSLGLRAIYNLATQPHPGPCASLYAIETAVRAMDDECRRYPQLGIRTVGLPRIGAGIGGLAWADVDASLRRIAAHSCVELVVVSLPEVSV